MGFSGTVTFTDFDGIRIFSVPRELDVYDAPTLRNAAIDVVSAGHYRLVVDLTGVTYIDSTGLGVLVGMLRRAKAHEGWVRLACMPERVQNLFDKTGLNKVFEVFDTVAAATATQRPHTAPRSVVHDDGRVTTRHTVQRMCNGCGHGLGDANEAELQAAVAGEQLPDVRAECRNCKPHQPTTTEAVTALVPGAEGVIDL